jgi:hypothetical protein
LSGVWTAIERKRERERETERDRERQREIYLSAETLGGRLYLFLDGRARERS